MKEIIQILAALLTPTVALFACIIAYRQWRTEQNKLKLALFEKRVAVYDAARRFIGQIITSGRVEDNWMHEFLERIIVAEWLLNEDVAKYLNKIYDEALKLHTLIQTKDTVNNEEKKKNIARFLLINKL